MTTYLTPHFTLEELDGVGAPVGVQSNLRRLSHLLEAVRSTLGVPLRVTSGYRDPNHNTAIGGVDGSQHITGEAADFVPIGKQMYASAKLIEAARNAGTFPAFGQLIYYPLSGHLHISLTRGTRDGEVLVKLADGRYSWFSSKLLAKFPGGTTGAVTSGIAMAVLAIVALAILRSTIAE